MTATIRDPNTGEEFAMPFDEEPDFLGDDAAARSKATAPAAEGPQFMDADWDDETPMVEPTLMPVDGGLPLLYAGESHMVYGQGGEGKSWLGYLVCALTACALSGRQPSVSHSETMPRSAGGLEPNRQDVGVPTYTVAGRPANCARTRRGASEATSYASTPGVRSRMQMQRTRDTQPEMAVRRLLHAMGLRYRVDRPPLKGLRRRADIVFGPAKVAVYLDGCFWHGCPEHGRPRTKANPAYWSEKMARNRARDADTDVQLAAAGWVVLRVWEHEDSHDVAERIRTTVKERQPRRTKARA